MANTNEPANISYNFRGVPVEQLLDIYADLVGRTLLQDSSGPNAVPGDLTSYFVNENPIDPFGSQGGY